MAFNKGKGIGSGDGGGTGVIPAFKNIAQRDAFFNTGTNSQLLEIGLPIIVNQGSAVTTFVWTEVDNPVTYDPDLFIEIALNSGPGTLFLGIDGSNLSSAGKTLNFNSAYGDRAIPLGQAFTDDGSTGPTHFRFTKKIIITTNDIFDTQLSAPRQLIFTGTVFNSYTDSLIIRPATTGTLRLKAYAGILNTDPIIVDTTYTISAGDIGNILNLKLPNGLLGVAGDEQLIVFDGVDFFGGLQTSGEFSGQTVLFFGAETLILTLSDLITRNQLDDYVLLNSQYNIAVEKSGGLRVITLPDATVDTVVAAEFIPGVDATSNPSVVTVGSNIFAQGEFVQYLSDPGQPNANDEVYEVHSHIGTALEIRGIGLNPTVEDGTEDQFVNLISTGTLTKVELSIVKLIGSQIFHGGGSTTPLTFHILAHASDVSIVLAEEFASTEAIFFGELGLPSGQGWTDTETAAGTLTVFNDPVLGRDVIKYDVPGDGDITKSELALTATNWSNNLTNGFSFRCNNCRITEDINTQSIFAGAGFSAANDPRPSSVQSRVGVFISEDGTNTTIRLDGQATVALDGLAGVPLIPKDTYFDWEVFVDETPDAGVNFGAATMFVNGVSVVIGGIIASNNAVNDEVSIANSSSTGTTTFYVGSFGVTIYEEAAIKTLSAVTMSADIIQIKRAKGNRDHTVILPDGNPRKLGNRLDFIGGSAGTKLKIQTENPAAPQALFNDFNEIEIDVVSEETISFVNTVENANIYVGKLEDTPTFEHSGLISSGELGGAQGMLIVDADTFQIQKIHAVIVDRKESLDSPKFIDIQLPKTDHTIIGGGDQVVNVYITKQGVYDFRPAEPKVNAITDEIFIGKAVMDAGVITVAVFTPVVAYANSVDGLSELITRGGQKTSGSILSPGGANLTLSVTDGSHQQLGRGYITDPNNPNICVTPGVSVIAFTGVAGNLFLVHADAGGGFVIDSFISSSATPDIDPTQFNNGGTLASVPVNDVTAQRVYQACGTNDIIIYYGTVAYANMAAAEAGFENEDPEILTTKDISYICTILVKETVTDLTAGVSAGDVIFKNRSGKRDL